MAGKRFKTYDGEESGGGVRYGILGPLEVVVDEEPIDLGPRKQRSLFALLLINHSRVVSTDRILEEIWGEDADGKENALWVYVSRLRSALGEVSNDEILVTKDHGYQLDIDPENLDSHRFEVLARRGSQHLRADPETAADDLRNALSLWRGHALEEFTYDDFARTEITRLEEMRTTCLDNRIEADLKRGLSGELIGELEALVDQRPLDERPTSQLMLAQYRAGRQADALRSFERYRRGLGGELGIDPSPELRRLEEQILLHDSRIQTRRADRSPATKRSYIHSGNPFRGLEAFREEDAEVFFGRDRLVTEILRRVEDRAMVAVVGASGCGKSSAVRSGVIPALRKGALPGSDSWLVAQMIPGSHPFAELEAALLRTSLDAPSSLRDHFDRTPDEMLRAVLRVLPTESSQVMIVIDQFEELFTLCDPDEASRFLTALHTAVQDHRKRVHVLLTLRSDFYGEPLNHADFGSTMGAGVVNVVPMAPEELEQAASKPAERSGVRLESGLEAALIGDVLGAPGALPLFQFALTDLFDRRVGDTLTLGAYHEMGGISGTVSRKAEQLYERLTATQQAAARQVFLRLVAITDETTRSRRRVEASELLALEMDVSDLQAVIDTFGQERLLSFDRNDVSGAPTVEVAHEALLEHWDRLASWIEEGREDVLANARLSAAAAEWSTNDRDPGYLLSGGRLGNYEQWAATSTMTLARREREYLDASVETRDEQAAGEAERLAREAATTKRAKRNAWSLVGVIMAVALVGSFLTWNALKPDGPTVALLYGGGTEDDGITEMLRTGLARADSDLDIVAIEVPVFRDPEGSLRQAAEAGAALLIADLPVSFSIDAVAPDYLETQFVAFDSAAPSALPNVLNVGIDVTGSNFLMGVVAASVSTSKSVGFIGAVQSDYFNHWVSAYDAGARATDPSVTVSASWLSGQFSEDAFRDPDGAYEAALHLYEQGIDVIFTAAGPSGKGTIRAARDYSNSSGRHVWAIGVDTDEGFLADEELQDYVLTSMIKAFDTALFLSIDAFVRGTLEPGTEFGLSDGVVGYSRIGGHIDHLVDQIEAVAAEYEADRIHVPAESAVPSTWSSPPDHTFTATFDGRSCELTGDSEVAGGHVVSVTFINATDDVASIGFASLPDGVSREAFTKELTERSDTFSALFALGGWAISDWTVPPRATYEKRAVFGGEQQGQGFVACWGPHDDLPYISELFPIDDE